MESSSFSLWQEHYWKVLFSHVSLGMKNRKHKHFNSCQMQVWGSSDLFTVKKKMFDLKSLHSQTNAHFAFRLNKLWKTIASSSALHQQQFKLFNFSICKDVENKTITHIKLRILKTPQILPCFREFWVAVSQMTTNLFFAQDLLQNTTTIANVKLWHIPCMSEIWDIFLRSCKRFL